MTCPICAEKTKVVDSVADVDLVYRRRKCVKCDHLFFTIESEADDEDETRSLFYKLKFKKA